jgi:hypothetical protein
MFSSNYIIIKVCLLGNINKDITTVDFMLYISYKTTFFKKLLWSHFLTDFDHFCTRRSRNIYRLFVYFSMIFRYIAFIFWWFKDNFCFLTSNLLYILTQKISEKSTFVFKSPENKNHAVKNYYQINK